MHMQIKVISHAFQHHFICKTICLSWLFAALIDHRRSVEDVESVSEQIANLTEEQRDGLFLDVFLVPVLGTYCAVRRVRHFGRPFAVTHRSVAVRVS